MKKVLLIFIVILFTESIHAQFSFGVKAGVNFSKFNTKEQVLKNDGSAWQVGVVSKFNIPLIGLGLQPELLYSVNKGEGNSIGYFQIPINLRWQPLPIPLIKPVILAGPYFGYAVRFKGFDNFRDNIERFDWGIGLGLGLEIWKLQFGGRYNWGLQNISGIRDFSLKSNVFTLSVAYFF